MVSFAKGGGGEAWGTWCRGPSLPPPHLAFLAPFFLHWFFTPRAFAIAKYWTLYCWVISPISLASHPLRVPSSRPSLSHLSLYFSPGLPQPFTSPYKWFNIKLIVEPLLFICHYPKKKKFIGTASLQVTFEGIRGPSIQSDIAIDDVSIVDGNCPGEKSK